MKELNGGSDREDNLQIINFMEFIDHCCSFLSSLILISKERP